MNENSNNNIPSTSVANETQTQTQQPAVNNAEQQVQNNTTQIPQTSTTQAPQTATTQVPSSSATTVPSGTPQNVEQKQEETTTPVEPEKKEGCFKYALAFIFLFLFAGFVIFIPDVTKFVKQKTSGKGKTTSETKVVEDGTLTCTRVKSSDETDINYKLTYSFKDKGLITSKYEITYESLNTDYLNNKKLECDEIEKASKETNGIDTNCSYKNGILIMTENYTNQDIDKSKLTAYTEIGGTYPEFNYGHNVYDIKTNLEKQGYDCEVKSGQ